MGEEEAAHIQLQFTVARIGSDHAYVLVQHTCEVRPRAWWLAKASPRCLSGSESRATQTISESVL